MSSAAGTGSEIERIVAEFCAKQYDGSGAERFGIGRDTFGKIVAGVVERWRTTSPGGDVAQFLTSLRTDELVLTRACAAGHNGAWEQFLARYRATLYSAAYKIAHDEASGRELADSLYAELYGISEKGADRRSKLLYYSGRGSLEGFLRTIVAQEYVNRYRRTRRETSLEEEVEAGKQFAAASATTTAVSSDSIDKAIAAEIAALEPDERLLLSSYYLDGRKLAEIARLERVHESTISRKLERVTTTLRKRIRKRLIEGGMSARQADELMQDVDVRDLQFPMEKIRQETPGSTFYKGSEP
ncbi:MAG TPA: sigma-70 family RNA polymerase sigma factor [Candidatus Koribacter sp.]|jgi:RNA polymerase sigma-70 factor (ECF subfamily)